MDLSRFNKQYTVEKILIISYRFPPADETGTQRTWALARYLHLMGYYPVFITRNWDIPLKTMEDRYLPTGKEVVHEKNNEYEVFTLPNKDILQLRINRKFKTRFRLIKKIYNLVDLILINNNCFILDEYNAFIKQADRVAKQYPEIKKAIVIADPYPLFFIGYYLSKKYGIKWIADYRDDWTTRTINDAYGFTPTRLHKMMHRLEAKSEKRWVGTADYITSVSEEYTNRISEFVHVPGSTVYNGFFEEDYKNYIGRDDDNGKNHPPEYVIIHSGTLYPQQQLEIFTEGLKKVIDEYKEKVDITVKFIGVLYKPGSEERIQTALRGYEKNYRLSLRLSKDLLFEEIQKAQLTLVISHGKAIKGIPTSKIFDYIALKKKVLCCPSDGDVLENILTETGVGYFGDSPEEVYSFLNRQINNFLNNTSEEKHIDYRKCLVYSRRHQTDKVARLLRKL